MLVAQIQAAGVGLNMQAASVVIICEPRIEPTVEHQTVVRTHRMGQVLSVRVHRLIATRGVDERMVGLLKKMPRSSTRTRAGGRSPSRRRTQSPFRHRW